MGSQGPRQGHTVTASSRSYGADSEKDRRQRWKAGPSPSLGGKLHGHVFIPLQLPLPGREEAVNK